MTSLRLAQIATKYGVPFRTGYKIARNAKRQDVQPALAFGLVEQESGFRNVFGCDFGPCGDRPPYCNQAVTEARYKRLRDYAIRTHRGNGVGLTQITYWTYLRDNADLWRMSAQLKLGFSIIKGYISRYGVYKGLAVYNGGAGNPQYDYAREVIARRDKWIKRFRRG